MRQLRYNPYAMELAGLVREGYLDREEAIRRLTEDAAPEMVDRVAARLGVPSPVATGDGAAPVAAP